MSPQDAIALLQAALVIVAPLAVLLWLLPGPCICAQCAFHVNERRMAKLRQKELEHDTAHKGFGFKDGTKDYLPCEDDTCPRNPRRVD